MFDWMYSPEGWIALATLTSLEVILGIDNIVIISILVDRLKESQRAKARTLGLGLALIMRVLLLLAIGWIISLQEPLFALFSHAVSGRDLIMLTGGLFLLGKATYDIHEKLEGEEQGLKAKQVYASFTAVITQIIAMDLIFSVDSVITAVGMAKDVSIMIIAVVISIVIMLLSVGTVSAFVSRHPTVKMLALSFLLLIGMTLIADGLHFHIPKGYVYFAMGFSILVEFLNLKAKKKKGEPVQLRQQYDLRSNKDEA